ncbi:MAG TPA: penicillin-binding transpeptidase domain-containing protein [Lachnospiraceae bacterium]|nr:penicillin-binding transpeptidase domain-containing protein [Lachnospiraceae bacterium]
MKNKTFNRKKIMIVFLVSSLLLIGLCTRIVYVMIFCSGYYTKEAQELHERERSIKAARGNMYDANGVLIASNKTVCTISVIHSQITNSDEVVGILSKELGLTEAYVKKRVLKYTSIERIKSNVDKEIGDRIRAYHLDGVKVDEDYKRFYPYGSLASKVLGFTGGDNQGIVGLEVIYEDYLKGIDGTILTVTDSRGVEIGKEGEDRIEPISGDDLYLSLDLNIQTYATQLAYQAMETKQADSVSMIVMNPQNGEILAMVNVPEFDLNNPYQLPENVDATLLTDQEKKDMLNMMWRNGCINDTYEPGSTFKIITSAACLEEGVVSLEDTFNCPGYIMVEDRRIRCHKVKGHGAETFLQGIMNSCNPVFVTIGLRLGADKFYDYFKKFGLLSKTNIDLPGEAATIMHKKENIGLVELATISFGQSFQITPIQLAVTASSIVNGGTRITPHFGVTAIDTKEKSKKTFTYSSKENIVSQKTSETMRYLLEQVVENGTGKNGYVEGFRVGGKTATSQTLPRSSNKYIASFIGFAPADNPSILAVAIINNPHGVYYGGQIAAPIVRQLFENILPYLKGIDYN